MPAREDSRRDERYRRLVWVTLLRLAVVTVLLGATTVLTFTERETLTGPVQSWIYTLTALVYLVSLFYLVSLRHGGTGLIRTVAWAQVVGDVAMAAFLVWLTGGNESIFAFLFTLAVINASILLYRQGALIIAGLSGLAYAGVTLALQMRWVPPAAPYLTPLQLPLARLVFAIAINSGAFVLVALLASWLAEQARRTGERLTRAEAGFAALSARHEQIVESVASGILTLDSSGRITFVNRAGASVLGRARTELIGRPLREVVPELWEAIEAGGGRGSGPRGEVKVRGGDGERYLGFNVSPLGPSEGLVVVFQDLTAMREMEALVRRNERLAALGVVAAGLAHEIRNPLASMSGSIELLRASLPERAEEARLMSIVLRETERLNRLISDFLLFARPAPPKFQPVDLKGAVARTLEVFRNDPVARQLEIDAQVPGGLVVRCDEEQLRQILLNLLLNAGQAMEGRGRVTLSAEVKGGEAHLLVTDDGPGMDAETARRIFDPFFTTRSEGTGLGLSTVHRLVEGQGGRISVQTAEGAGTTFVVTLPLAVQADSTQPAKAG